MECICDSCRFLKSIPGAQEGEITLECEYGFPCAECETCELEGCDAACEHYAPYAESAIYRVPCASCGKELTVTSEPDDSPVYCMDCYLSR